MIAGRLVMLAHANDDSLAIALGSCFSVVIAGPRGTAGLSRAETPA